jgi:L-aspartate oxidase
LAGSKRGNVEAISVLSHSANDVITDLIDRGFVFDSDENKKLLYTKEAAHRRARILHAGGDATGRYMHQFLLEQNPHAMLTNTMVVDLLVEDGHCYGITVTQSNKTVIKNLYANNVIIASGGLGSLMQVHTNSRSISADLQGIAIEKGIEVENMHYLQFHPTVFVNPKNQGARKQLLSEALRGEGAKVVDSDGVEFLYEYDDRGELASRDIVSRAIYDYHKKTGKQVFLSFDTFNKTYLKNRFPNIYKNLKKLGFDITKQPVPISPAFHYAVGGIKTDLDGAIAGYDNLFAVGEVASTGVHGANRLASNSLLEGLVFAKRAAKKLSSEVKQKVFNLPTFALTKLGDEEIKAILREKMWHNVGIVRKRSQLLEVKVYIDDLLSQDIGRLLKLRLLSAKAIVDHALEAKTSVGVHYVEE